MRRKLYGIYTAKEIAYDQGLSHHTVSRRARLGVPFDAPKYNAKTYEFRGEQLTIREISERTGVPIPTIYSRIKKGFDMEDAVSDKDFRKDLRKEYEKLKDELGV